ncbi:GntP family permease [Actinotignum sp. GS-2025a]|uniref:GntP family permease n=1 Tax=Actinotignum sp. GS-2025a TaxID=3427274 RepID=UPI003F477AE1
MTLTTGGLLGIALAAIAVLLFLIIVFKVNATVALILVSALTAIATGVPVSELFDMLLTGFSGTVGKLALIIGFGAIIGRMLEQSGGAEVLAQTLLRWFGEKRAPLALSVASLLFGFPIFFDAGLIVMFPIIFSVARRLGGSVLLYALPAAGAFQVMHGLMPPHPGPVAAATTMNINIGTVLLVGLIVAIPTWYLAGYRFALWLSKRFDVPIPNVLGSKESGRELPGKEPAFATVLFILMLPILLITGNTVTSTLQSAGIIPENAAWASALKFFGETAVALFVTALVASIILGYVRKVPWKNIDKINDAGFKSVAAIVMVAGAGGMFGSVLRETGIGTALANTLADLGIPLLLAAYLISLALRVAQGSATVAIQTTAALLAATVSGAGLNDIQTALVVVAMGAGSFFASHVNDSGFWLVGGFLQVDTKTNLKMWTTFTSVISLVSFGFCSLVYLIV